MSTAAPVLAPDLVDGLRRLKLAAMRQLAPELLRTAKTQRWAPEELLRTLIEAEIAARDASNARTRLKTAAFPVVKTLDEFDRAVSSIPPATLDYLASLEWITAKENLCLVGPAGTGKSHLLVALGVAAVNAGHRVRYFTAAELVPPLGLRGAQQFRGELAHRGQLEPTQPLDQIRRQRRRGRAHRPPPVLAARVVEAPIVEARIA